MIVTNITAHKFEGKHFNSENKKKLNLEIPSQQNCCLISAPKCRHTALNEENKPKVSLTWLARCCTEQCVRLCVSVLCLLPSSTKQGWAREGTKVNKTMVSPSTFGVAPVTVFEGTSAAVSGLQWPPHLTHALLLPAECHRATLVAAHTYGHYHALVVFLMRSILCPVPPLPCGLHLPKSG